METCLIPVLKPGQVVVMDNGTFHKGGRIEQLIQQAGCELLYLPADSPDFNRIERCWSWITSRIHKSLDQFECLRDAIEYVLPLGPNHPGGCYITGNKLLVLALDFAIFSLK